MPNIIDQPITLADGETLFTGNVNNAVTRFMVRLARMTTATPSFWTSPSTVVDVMIWTSVDNGQSFQFLTGFQAHGGIHSFKGVEMPSSTIEINMPIGTQRRIQARIFVTSGPLVSQMTVEVF